MTMRRKIAGRMAHIKCDAVDMQSKITPFSWRNAISPEIEIIVDMPRFGLLRYC